MTEERLKTGTTTVGIVCKDGIVLAADMRATAGNMIVNSRTDKVIPIADNIAVTMAGTVSDAQLVTKLIKAELNLIKIRNSREPTLKESANLLAGMVYQNIRKMSMIPGIAHFIIGGKDETGHSVYDIFPDGSIQEVDDFISSGSGSVFAYGVLETHYKSEMTVDQGVKVAVKAINTALKRDSASGNGVNVFTITSEGMKKLTPKVLSVEL
tara:strand:+ start:364 stop:996 length:633 start_codon:yes stop_codon:yes gene_type:complete